MDPRNPPKFQQPQVEYELGLGAIEAVGERRLLVRTALFTTEVELGDGNLHYWRFRGSHTVVSDCPEFRPDLG